MIIDQLRNWPIYSPVETWKKAFQFLSSLPDDITEGRHEIDGDDVFAIVMSYQTCARENAILESHRTYVDIQMVLQGAELCECSPSAGLPVSEPYDAAKDAEFYACTEPGAVSIKLVPGRFVALFPDDAHMPCLTLGETPSLVKKVVVKIKRSSLTP